ncbi:hypothetical protein R1flu_002829 [Riccia fluitans]|uniref:Uncharacterized protein n=1 Tax=Riccia fluitans TaxID=41844 RepID=A0ABD1YB09_9MARC
MMEVGALAEDGIFRFSLPPMSSCACKENAVYFLNSVKSLNGRPGARIVAGFVKKNLAGTGRVFETVSTVDGFTVKESRQWWQ